MGACSACYRKQNVNTRTSNSIKDNRHQHRESRESQKSQRFQKSLKLGQVSNDLEVEWTCADPKCKWRNKKRNILCGGKQGMGFGCGLPKPNASIEIQRRILKGETHDRSRQSNRGNGDTAAANDDRSCVSNNERNGNKNNKSIEKPQKTIIK